jgi:hypothetical protein
MKINVHIHTLVLSFANKKIVRRFKHTPTSTGFSKSSVEDSDGDVKFMSNEGFKYISAEEFAKIK